MSRQLAELCEHGRLDCHAIKDNVVQVGGNYEMCPGGRLVAATPIPWCATHGLPIGQFGYTDPALKPTDCVGIVMGWHGDCLLEDPPEHYRIEASDG